MRVLSKAQCQSMPIDEIKEINLWWVDQLRQTPQYRSAEIKYKTVDMLKFIKQHCPELEYQFQWAQMSANERMITKFPYVSKYKPSQGFYDAYDNGLRVDDDEYLDYYYSEQ